MNTTSTSKMDSVDRYVKSVGLVLGVVSAAITVYVAVTTYKINQRLQQTQAENAERDRSLKDIQLTRDKLDNSVRLGYEFGVSNAKAFALDYLQEKSRFDWIDPTLRANIEAYVEPWKTGRRLMTGTHESGVFLRQIVWIRVANTGKRPAKDIRIQAFVKDFNNENGTLAGTINELRNSIKDGKEVEYTLPALMEASSSSLGMRTATAFPLLHVSGSTRFFGRIVLPTKISWKDAMTDASHSIDIDYHRETLLLNSVGSAVLGRMN